MLNHIRLKHKEKFDRPETPEKQPTLSNFVNSPRSRKCSGKETDDITRAIVDMVVFDYMPLQMVEGKGFKKLMSIVAPNYNIPSRNTIKSRIEKVYEDRKSAVLGELDRVDTVALTTDTWTSNATKSYLTITEHHIDSDWNLMTNVLLTREMPERHTGENIAENLKKYTAEFNLNGKVSEEYDKCRKQMSRLE